MGEGFSVRAMVRRASKGLAGDSTQRQRYSRGNFGKSFLTELGGET